MGQPTRSHQRVSHAEYIGMGGDTRGSETSQYPEEKKSNEIPQVAASERGRAQTHAYAKAHTVVRGVLQVPTGAICKSS